MVFTTLTPFPYEMTPMANVQGVSYADGTTWLRELAEIKNWLNETLVPESNAGLANAIAEFQNGIANAEQTITDSLAAWETDHAAAVAGWQAAFDTLTTDYNTFKTSTTAGLAASQAAAQAGWQATFDAFLADVEAQLAALNDSAVAGLINTPASAVAGALTTFVDGKVDVRGDVLDARIDALDDEATYNYFDLRHLFNGVHGWAYGNSWINSANYGATQYPLRLPGLIGLTDMVELADSGYRMQDTSVHILGTDATYTWPAGRKGFVVIGDLLNNLIEADTTANRDTALEALRASVALISAGARTEAADAAFTYSGTWSTLSATSLSNGSAKYVSHTVSNATEGVSYIDVAIPAGLNYLCFTGTMLGSATNGGVAIIREGATELGRIATDDKSVATPYGMAAGARAPVVFKIPGTTARTVRVTFTGRTATSESHILIADCLLPQSTTPPMIVVVKPVQVLIGTHDKPDLLTYLRTVPDTVAAEFSNVLVVDPAPGWNTSTMLGADQLHPNEAGQAYLADTITKAIKAEFLLRARRSAFGTLI